MDNFSVTINYQGTYGYVEYDPATKKAAVVIASPEAVKRVEDYLGKEQSFEVPGGNTIREFEGVTMNPLADLESFKVCLTRLWVNTDVRVEWSMPPGMAENL